MARDSLELEEPSISIVSRLCLVEPSIDKFRLRTFCHTLYHTLKNSPFCVREDGTIKDATTIQVVASSLCRSVRLFCAPRGGTSVTDPQSLSSEG